MVAFTTTSLERPGILRMSVCSDLCTAVTLPVTLKLVYLQVVVLHDPAASDNVMPDVELTNSKVAPFPSVLTVTVTFAVSEEVPAAT